MIISGIITLGKDSEIKRTQTGTAVLSFSGAYSIGYGDKKETVWLKCAMFGKQAESVAQHFTKGTKLDIVGKDLKLNTYQKQDGTQGHALEVIVIEFEFAGSKQTQQGAPIGGQQYAPAPQQMQPQQPQQQYAPAQQQAPQRPAPAYAPNDFDDDDVPF